MAPEPPPFQTKRRGNQRGGGGYVQADVSVLLATLPKHSTTMKHLSAGERKSRRRSLRRNATKAEILLWQALRSKQCQGRKFRRQHSIGPFIVDFYCPQEKLIVEVEGSIHDDPSRREYDYQRHRYLEACGNKVIYIDNQQVIYQIEAVLEAIQMQFRER